jgi:hypothetical protein
MAVKKKQSKETSYQPNVDDIINRGGTTTLESQQVNEQANELEKDEARFTLRIPQSLIDQIDRKRKERVGNVSRNQWIIESIVDRMK